MYVKATNKIKRSYHLESGGAGEASEKGKLGGAG